MFYRVNSDVTKSIKETLRKQFSSNDERIELEFEEIDDANKLKEKVEKDENISLIFSNTVHFPFNMAKTSPFDISLYETFPSCVKRYSFGALEKNAEGASSLPILLDTYHLFFNNMMFESEDEANFYNIEGFSSMLEKVSKKAKYPLLCAGGENETLLFFCFYCYANGRRCLFNKKQKN